MDARRRGWLWTYALNVFLLLYVFHFCIPATANVWLLFLCACPSLNSRWLARDLVLVACDRLLLSLLVFVLYASTSH